jgi:hypothetical protein
MHNGEKEELHANSTSLKTCWIEPPGAGWHPRHMEVSVIKRLAKFDDDKSYEKYDGVLVVNRNRLLPERPEV